MKLLPWLLIFAIGQAADVITFLFLPPGGEANPIVVALGSWAVPVRLAFISIFLLLVPLMRPFWQRAGLMVAGFAGAFGASTNLNLIVKVFLS